MSPRPASSSFCRWTAVRRRSGSTRSIVLLKLSFSLARRSPIVSPEKIHWSKFSLATMKFCRRSGMAGRFSFSMPLPPHLGRRVVLRLGLPNGLAPDHEAVCPRITANPRFGSFAAITRTVRAPASSPRPARRWSSSLTAGLGFGTLQPADLPEHSLALLAPSPRPLAAWPASPRQPADGAGSAQFEPAPPAAFTCARQPQVMTNIPARPRPRMKAR